MRKRNYTVLLTAIAFLSVGCALLLDAFDVSFVGIIGIKNVWFPVLVILIGCGMFLSMIIRKKADFIATATVIFVIGVMLLLLRLDTENLTFARVWPMIILAPSLALLFTYIFRSRYKLYLRLGLFTVAVSIALLVGSVFDLWIMVAPIIIIFIGAVMLIYAFTDKESDDDKEIEIPSISIVARKQEIEREQADKQDKEDGKNER